MRLQNATLQPWRTPREIKEECTNYKTPWDGTLRLQDAVLQTLRPQDMAVQVHNYEYSMSDETFACVVSTTFHFFVIG